MLFEMAQAAFKGALRELQAAYPGKFETGAFSHLAGTDVLRSARCIAGWTMELAPVGELVPAAQCEAERAGWSLELHG